MLINGIAHKEKFKYLIDKYNRLILSGINSKKIIAIVLNSYKKALFINELKKTNPNIDDNQIQIFTFQGLCYNAFLDNWEYISNLINNSKSHIKPNLCGLEVSQFIFKQSIKEADFSDYISKVNLLHQLFRRYSLEVQNKLSNQEILDRSKILNEVFALDAQKAIEDYKLKTIQYKSFDYLRQMAILPLIYNNTDYFKDIEYLIIDDADEFSYAFWQFIDAIMPQIKDYCIAYDERGSSRCGYLCAYKSGISDFGNKYSPQKVGIKNSNIFANEAEEFYLNLKNGAKTTFRDIKSNSAVKRLDMIENVVNKIKLLLNNGVKANDIVIITPISDNILTQTLIEKTPEINYQTISGNEKLSDINIIKNILTVLKIVNNIDIKDYEIKNLLIKLLNIPFKKCFEIIKTYNSKKEFIEFDFNNIDQNEKYTKLKTILNSLKKTNNSLSEQIKIIYTNLIKDVIQNKELKKFDFLLKEAISFETAFKNNIVNITEQFIIQIENSVISENPAETIFINNNAIIIGTPQKIIDLSISAKYQLWLDISSSEWLKEDTGTLYNAWVLNRDWKKEEYALEDNISLTRDKTARIVRKLMYCAEKQISFFSSLYDNSGNENFGGLTDFIEVTKEESKQEFKITPREDQKAVLEYKKGRMGIMAVPGAGKTTILLALIIKLIKEGTHPENIFVLTYMESAAKNFKERIKSALPENLDVPNISTIHGLALRIIKENANYTKIGLDDNFEICDDNTKERIIKELLLKTKTEEDKFDNYLRCISIVKLSENNENLTSKHKEIQDFFNFYAEYNNTLKQNNLIDYDDMLYYAVKILKNNPDVLRYYQNICKYIIEDDAQDSSEIQQRLLNLLSGKYNNLVRCGDINQAITSTFTNSDTEGFKKFLNTNTKVEMNSSQRCAQPIFELANKLINTTIQNENLKTAFYNIEMKGTDRNPKSDKTPYLAMFDEEFEEKEFILNKINEIQKNNPQASIAILLRLNSQVNEYNDYFIANGIKTTVRTDCLSQKSIYKFIISVLKIIQMPLNNKNIIELAMNYKEQNICKIKNKDIDFLKELKEAFVQINSDNLTSEGLNQLYWDIDYWLNESISAIEEIALKIGLYYAKTSTDKSNTYLISTFIKRLKNKNENFEEVIKQLEFSATRPLSAYKFFEEEQSANIGSVNIMTMHKSKGDEFDFVFIAQMNEDNYPLLKENVKIKGGGHFLQTIKSLIEKTPIKTPDEQKQELIHETLRLLYVGITRAKSELIFTSAKKYKKHKPTKFFSFFEELLLERN